MATKSFHQQKTAEDILTGLQSCIIHKNKKRILELYKLAESVEWDLVHENTSDEYDELVSECNDILYEN